MPLSQKYLPIIFALYGSGIPIVVPFGIPGLGLIRPEQLSIQRSSRGTLMNTAEDAFLQDFGEGIPRLTIAGHTGWDSGPLSGLPGFKLLEALFVDYLQQRRRLATSGQDPNKVQLLYIDTLNVEAFSVYPHEFTLERTKQRPLLYMYRMQFSVLKDLLQSALFSPTGDFLATGTFGGDFVASVGSLGDSIFNTAPASPRFSAQPWGAAVTPDVTGGPF
jgi:hypothetical protein